MPLRFAVVFLSLMLIYPRESLAAAQEAFLLWQQTVAPSLLPFFALIPALTSDEATACFSHLLRLPCRMLGIPADFAGAAGIALAAGSPAGARALMRIAAGKRYAAGALLRGAMLCAGVSPGFLISGVGAGMLRNPSAGAVLLAAQLLALITASLLLRAADTGGGQVYIPPAQTEAPTPPIAYAVNGVLAILVWMTLFCVGTRIASLLLPSAAQWIPFIGEFSAGCAHAVRLQLPICVLGGVIGFGGICAACQNLSVLRPAGIPPQMYIACKAMHAALCAVYAHLLQHLSLPALSFAPQHVLPVLILVCLLPLFRKILHAAPK